MRKKKHLFRNLDFFIYFCFNRLPPLDFRPELINADNSVDVVAQGKFPHRFSMDLIASILDSKEQCDTTRSNSNFFFPTIAFESSTPEAIPIGRIGIVGGDSTLHNILCSYVTLKLNAPQLFDYLDLR